MKKHTFLILALLLSYTCIAQNEAFNAMSFNIRFSNPGDGFNYWPNRKDLVTSMIRYHEAEIIGVQEAMRSQLDDLMTLLPGYKWIGLCRTDGTTSPEPDNEFTAILYNPERFKLLEQATFWLSEKPDEVGIKGWDAALPRTTTWAFFEDRNTGKRFYLFNTHFDHVGEQARAESARLIRAKIVEIAKEVPVVLTGDFNCVETDEPYRVLTDKKEASHLQDALFISKMPHHGPLATWTNSFQFPGVPGKRIDFIFVKNKVTVFKHAILSDSWSGRLPSDHLPVLATIKIE